MLNIMVENSNLFTLHSKVLWNCTLSYLETSPLYKGVCVWEGGEGGREEGVEFFKVFQKVGGPEFSHKKRGVGMKGRLL